MARQGGSTDILFAQIEALALENGQWRDSSRQKNNQVRHWCAQPAAARVTTAHSPRWFFQIEGLVAHVYDLRRQLDRFQGAVRSDLCRRLSISTRGLHS